jgi:hypothetical protein
MAVPLMLNREVINLCSDNPAKTINTKSGMDQSVQSIRCGLHDSQFDS